MKRADHAVCTPTPDEKLRMPAYRHYHGFVVSLSRVNQDESTPQGFTAPDTCPALMAATDIDIRVAWLPAPCDNVVAA